MGVLYDGSLATICQSVGVGVVGRDGGRSGGEEWGEVGFAVGVWGQGGSGGGGGGQGGRWVRCRGGGTI